MTGHLLATTVRWCAVAAAAIALLPAPAVAGASRPESVTGTEGNDHIITKRGVQQVFALGGDDYVRLGSGDDIADGDDGNDELEGNAGSDILIGGPGNDHPEGGSGDDRLQGASGDDELDGDAGNDVIFAGSGNDQVTGDAGDDVLYPGPGIDEVYAEQGANRIVAADDGVADELWCGTTSEPGVIVYVGSRDPLDVLRNCQVVDLSPRQRTTTLQLRSTSSTSR